MFSIQIGYIFTELGIFQNIDWGADSHFVQVELDENGGTNYKIVGTTQLLRFRMLYMLKIVEIISGKKQKLRHLF